jgi:hypothetical protein
VLTLFVLQVAFDAHKSVHPHSSILTHPSPPIHPHPSIHPFKRNDNELLRVFWAVCRIKLGGSTLHCSHGRNPHILPSPPNHQKPSGLTADGFL